MSKEMNRREFLKSNGSDLSGPDNGKPNSILWSGVRDQSSSRRQRKMAGDP